MRSPNLDRRITVQSATETPDDRGTPVQTWSAFVANEPAEYLPHGGNERIASDRPTSIATAQFRIRYRSDITPAMRVVYEGEIFNISHAEEDRRFERRQYLLITGQTLPAE